MTAKKATKPAKKTAKKKDGRGGARPGAGRKKSKKPEGEAALRSRTRIKARPARVAMASPEQVERARKYAGLALDTWADIAANGQSENARNAAAAHLMEWGYGQPLGIGNETLRSEERSEPKAKPLGKKEALIEAAKNPDETTEMGKLLAERAAQANQKLDS